MYHLGFRMLAITALLMLMACDKKVPGVGYYLVEGSTPTTPQDPRVMVLNNGIVGQYPRDPFTKAFGSEAGMSTAIGTTLESILPQLGEHQITVIQEEQRAKKIKRAVAQHFGGEALLAAETARPIPLPLELQDGAGPIWLITDWEYLVTSHVKPGASTTPGGAVVTDHKYGYYEIVIYGMLLDKKGRLQRYVSTRARDKYIQTAGKLPLDRLLKSAVGRFAKLMNGAEPEITSPTLPQNFNRM